MIIPPHDPTITNVILFLSLKLKKILKHVQLRQRVKTRLFTEDSLHFRINISEPKQQKIKDPNHKI